MRVNKRLLLLVLQCLALCLSSYVVYADDAEARVWNISGVGEVRASVVRTTGVSVILKNEKNKKAEIELSKLSIADNKYLVENFKPKQRAEYVGCYERDVTVEGFRYILTVPDSYSASKASHIIFDISGICQSKINAEPYVTECTGAIRVSLIGVEKLDAGVARLEHVEKYLKHVCEHFSIGIDAVTIIADSVMIETAFQLAAKYEVFGLLVYTGYIPKDLKLKCKVFCAVTDSRSYRRYDAAYIVRSFKDNGFHFFSYGSSYGSLPMLWVYSKYQKFAKVKDAERKIFAENLLKSIELIAIEKKYCYYYLLKKEVDFDVSFGKIHTKYLKWHKGMRVKPSKFDKLKIKDIRLEYDGMIGLQEFSRKYFAPLGEGDQDLLNYIDESASKAADKAMKKYSGLMHRNSRTLRILRHFQYETLPDEKSSRLRFPLN